MSLVVWKGKDATGKISLGKYVFSKFENEYFSITKIRVDEKCRGCQKIIPKGSFCYGSRYYRTCLSCYPIVVQNFIDSLDKKIQELKEHLINHEKNNTQYLKNNIFS